MKDTDIMKHIEKLCKDRDWTVYKLAKESGIPYSTLNNMFHRTNIPSIPTLRKICNGLGLSLSDFFSEQDSQTQLNEQQKELLDDFDKLNAQDKRIAIAYISGLLRKL